MTKDRSLHNSYRCFSHATAPPRKTANLSHVLLLAATFIPKKKHAALFLHVSLGGGGGFYIVTTPPIPILDGVDVYRRRVKSSQPLSYDMAHGIINS